MKRKLTVAAVGAAVFLGGLTGCSQQERVTGTVVEKEYEPRNCEVYRSGKCRSWDPAEHELTIEEADGAEVELVVSKDVYDRADVNDTGTWKGVID